VVAVVGAAVGLGWLTWRRSTPAPSAPAKLKLRQLTALPPDKAVDSAAISPDGRYLAYLDDAGLQLMSIDTGETRQLPFASSETRDIDRISWFPDGTRLLLSDASDVLISYSIMSGTERRLRGEAADDLFGEVSPDGSLIAFTDQTGIWTMTATGEEVRQIIHAGPGESVGPTVWAPDGHRLAYRSGVKDQYWGRAIKSVDVQGQGSTVIAQAGATPYVNFCWLNGRVVYSERSSEDPSGRTVSDLWEIGVDDRSGRPTGSPRKITSLTGFDVEYFTAAQDGSRLAFKASRWQEDVYVGRLEAGGVRLEAPRRQTLDTRWGWPTGWMPDGRSILLASDRNGTLDIFKQEVDSSAAEIVYATPNAEMWAVATPDGSSLLIGQRNSQNGDAKQETYKLIRLPVSGGPPRAIFEAELKPGVDYGARCARRFCVLCEKRPTDLAFCILDPDKGKGREIFRVEKPLSSSWRWDISPDGTRIAILEYEGELQIISVPDGTVRTSATAWAGWGWFESVAWSHDGTSLFVAGKSGRERAILRVDLKGGVHVLWRHREYIDNLVPSPDGRFLALSAASYEANVWMIEDF
jgi:Tol biopolymer transport system component